MYFLFPSMTSMKSSILKLKLKLFSLYCAIFLDKNIAIENSVFLQDIFHDLLIDLKFHKNNISPYMRQTAGAVKFNTSSLGDNKVNIRWTLIQSQADHFKFSSQFSLLFLSLSGIQDHENQITGLGDGNNLEFLC
jgi:hypothetical protein